MAKNRTTTQTVIMLELTAEEARYLKSTAQNGREEDDKSIREAIFNALPSYADLELIIATQKSL